MRGHAQQRHLRPAAGSGSAASACSLGAGLDPGGRPRPVRVLSHRPPRRGRRSRAPHRRVRRADALPCPPHRVHQVHTRTVGQVDVAGGGQQDEVGRAADRDPADVLAAQRPRAAAGRGAAAPAPTVSPHLAHGQRDAERHRGRERGARVAVGRQRDDDPGVQQPAGVRVGRAGAELGARAAAWRRCRSRPARRRRRRVRWVQWSAEAAPSSTASATPGPGPSWLACTRRPSPAAAAGREHGAGLVGVERAALAEHVDPAGGRGAGVEHRPGDQVEVAGTVVRRTPRAPRGRRGT